MQAMLGNDQGDTLSLQIRDNVHEDSSALVIQVGRRLVKQQQVGPPGNRRRERHPLLLTARQLGEILLKQIRHTGESCSMLDARDRFVGSDAEIIGSECDLVEHRVHEELAARILHHYAEARSATTSTPIPHVASAYLYATGKDSGKERAGQPVNHTQNGGFAAA